MLLSLTPTTAASNTSKSSPSRLPQSTKSSCTHGVNSARSFLTARRTGSLFRHTVPLCGGTRRGSASRNWSRSRRSMGRSRRRCSFGGGCRRGERNSELRHLSFLSAIRGIEKMEGSCVYGRAANSSPDSLAPWSRWWSRGAVPCPTDSLADTLSSPNPSLHHASSPTLRYTTSNSTPPTWKRWTVSIWERGGRARGTPWTRSRLMRRKGSQEKRCCTSEYLRFSRRFAAALVGLSDLCSSRTAYMLWIRLQSRERPRRQRAVCIVVRTKALKTQSQPQIIFIRV